MPSLLETLTALLDERGAAPVLAARIGGAEADTEAAIGPALARVIDGMAALAADDHGALMVGGLVDRYDTPLADELDAFLADGPPGPGNVILDRVFGAERGLVVIGLASALGLAPSLVGRLLPLLAPLVTAELSRRRDRSGLDERAVADVLSVDRDEITRAGVLEGTTFSDAGFNHRAPDRDRARDLPPGGSGRADEGDGAREAANVATIEVVVPSADQASPSDTPSTAVAGQASTTTELRRRPKRSEAGPSSPSAPTTAPEVPPPAGDGTVGHDDAGRRGGSGDGDDGGEGEVVSLDPGGTDRPGVASDGDGEDAEATATPAVDPTSITIDADEALTPAPAPAPAPRLAAGDAVPGARGTALAWLGWAIGAVVLVLLLAWLLSTCAGGRVEAEPAAAVINVGGSTDTTAGDPAGDQLAGPSASNPDAGVTEDMPAATTRLPITRPDVAAAVDSTLAGTGVVGTLDGGTVTLTGTVSDAEVRDGIEARVAVLLGVEQIDNQLVVVTPPVADEATGGDPIAAAAAADAAGWAGEATAPSEPAPEPGTVLNDVLGLPPITFATASADLTDAGRVVVDQVADHLRQWPTIALTIDGHTDDDGAEDANQELSQQRADAVLARLVEAGIASERLVAVGHGETSPKVPNDSLDNKAVNRRIELVVR